MTLIVVIENAHQVEAKLGSGGIHSFPASVPLQRIPPFSLFGFKFTLSFFGDPFHRDAHSISLSHSPYSPSLSSSLFVLSRDESSSSEANGLSNYTSVDDGVPWSWLYINIARTSSFSLSNSSCASLSFLTISTSSSTAYFIAWGHFSTVRACK